MQARVVATARGAHWLAEGWRLFRAAPAVWLLLAFGYFVLTQIVALIPVVGSAAAAIVIPGFTLGFMAVARAATRGVVDASLLFEGFRHDARRQLTLGVVYMACGLLLFAAVFGADAEGALRAVFAGERDARSLEPAELLLPAAAFALVYVPTTMMFWFAPPLCAWHSLGVAKALFFSFFACLLNWRALLAYGAGVAAAMLVVNGLALIVVRLGAALSAQQLFAFALASLLLFLPVLFASFYASYRDVFGYDSPA